MRLYVYVRKSNSAAEIIQYGMGIFNGKNYFIYGDGVSGRAARRAIKRNGGRARIYSDENGSFVAPTDKRYDGGIISPGVRPTHEAYAYCAENGIRAMSETEIGFALAGDRKTVGVTGTNGKTTVTRLIAAMLGGVACGNIGYPVSDAACKTDGRPLVVELSSFQLYTAEISPSVAVITNIASDHIDWHGSDSEYCRCKCNVARRMTGGTLVLGEDIRLRSLETLETGARILHCRTDGICDGAYIADGYFVFMGERVCAVDYLRLQGEHNVKNALCAIAAAMSLGADAYAVRGALSTVAADAHRIECVGTYGGKLWIDDSKGTNVSACRAAVAQTAGEICLIAGGRGKATDFSELFVALDKRVTEVIAMGETAQEIRDSAVRYARGLKVTVVDGLDDAVNAAKRSDAHTVLLSPACASFDEFDGYAARGARFQELVRALDRCAEREKCGH